MSLSGNPPKRPPARGGCQRGDGRAVSQRTHASYALRLKLISENDALTFIKHRRFQISNYANHHGRQRRRQAPLLSVLLVERSFAKLIDPRQNGLFDAPLVKWIKPCLPTLADKPQVSASSNAGVAPRQRDLNNPPCFLLIPVDESDVILAFL